MTKVLPFFVMLITCVSAADYSRSEFGRWQDADRDCQNTRHELLIEQSTVRVTLSENGCRAVHGRWISIFTGAVITDASKLDIDHIVPLAWAWERGADAWPREKRIRFSNDPRNLAAVESSLNRSKGARGPESWLPPKNQCQYIARFQRVSLSYGLPFDRELRTRAGC